MSSSFSVTTSTNTVLLDLNRRGRATFTVSNISGHSTRGRARLTPQNPEAASWLTLGGETEREFPIASTQLFTVAIAVPTNATPGSYVFRLDMVGVENPDEDLSQGPSVTFQVAAITGGTKFPIPWWIIAVAAGVLVVAAIIIAVVLSAKVTVLDVSGVTQAAAERELQEAGFKVGTVSRQNSGIVPHDLVVNTDPPAGDKVSKGTSIDIILSDGPAATLTPTPTQTATVAPTPIITRTPTATKSPDTTGLLAYYPLHSDANEAANRTEPMILMNAPFTLGGVFCTGVYENLALPNSCKISTRQLEAFNYSSFSISVRFNPAEVKEMPVVMGGALWRWIGYYLLQNGHVALKYNNGNPIDCNLSYSPGDWYDALVTYDGAIARLYLNGTQACSQTFTLAQGGDKDISMTHFSNGKVFHGVVSDLKIYNIVITP